MRTIPLLLLALLTTGGCGSDESCETGAAGNGGYTIALDGVCLRDVAASSRDGASWTEASLELEPAEDGGVVVVIAGDPTSSGLRIEVPGLEFDTLFQQGYQSWGFAGTVEVPRFVTVGGDGAAAMRGAATGDPIDEEHGVSFHAALLRQGGDGPVLVIGALTAERAVTGIAAVRGDEGTALEVIYGPAGESLGSGRSEPIYLAAAADPDRALELLSARVAAANAGFTPARPPGGWFSWNEHFTDIDPALIAAHIDTAADRLLPAGMPLVEIDDGWEVDWGDWRAGDRFPAGMESIGQAITARGLVAGIWMAPFLVDVTSAAAARAPELFVRDGNGDRLVHQISGISRSFYVLDGSNPESLSLVVNRVSELAAAGYTFFKLDFLYAGALPGTRSQPVTGVEALRAGLASIRAAAGSGAIINACGAPTLPVVGRADSLRVGADTAFDGFTLSWSLVVSAARNLAARSYLFPAVWPDADQVQLRAPFTVDEARAGAVVSALAGPAYALGDDLTLLPGERLDLALDAVVLDLAGATAPARPRGLMTLPADEIVASPVLESFRFLGGVATEPPPRFEMIGASGAHYEITFDWVGDHRVTVDEVMP